MNRRPGDGIGARRGRREDNRVGANVVTPVQLAGINDFAGASVVIMDEKGFGALRSNEADTRCRGLQGVSADLQIY